ncbi:glycosyltransferase family 4 protein [Mariprofundus ferrooxydans]|uniref:glycosyltransferase family 4 protein n=1 Tax=Mariprofundus ferrooxydans TaxID=314344 RepID=UPI001430983F|nr:glycosyltransferase family 1 protein [Mariprofundus ferrooxydans]
MSKRQLFVCLIETAPAGHHGSMARYAELLESALNDTAGEVRVKRVNLALSQHALSRVPARFRMWAHHGWIMLGALFRLRRTKADVYHLLDGSHGYVARFLPAGRTVVTAHDIIPLLQMRRLLGGDPPGRGGRVVVNAGIRGLQRSRMVVCVSTSTLDDLRVHAGIGVEKMSVVFSGLSGEVTASAKALPDWHERRYREGAYILHLGHNGFYKNRAGTVRIFSMIYAAEPAMRLKLAGPPLDAGLTMLVEELELSDRVECIPNPEDGEVADLYRHAALLLFPSVYEGFGWPPLEAMAFGCPVVCSSEGSLSEVAADAALTAAVEDERELADHCLNILQNDAVAEEMVGRGFKRIRHFQPQQMAEKLIEIYRKVGS